MQTHALIATCDPQFVELAEEELQAVAPGVNTMQVAAPGVLRVVHGQTFDALATYWAQEPPIFVRHICPIHVAGSLRGDEEDLETLVQYVASDLHEEVAEWAERALPFSIQTRLFAPVDYRPFAVNDAVAALVEELTGAPLDVRNPEQVLSIVVLANEATGELEALLGVSSVAQNLSDWAGGARRFAREDGQVSRSEFKLLEALDVFGIELLPRSTALDLGASPGGWTRVLRQKELYVTAVDPGELDPRLAEDRGIRFKRMTAEAYLRDDPDRFDLIVNDMRMDGGDSARMMARYAPYLYPHGMAIVTIKLPERNAGRVLNHALKILGEAYTVAGVRQLFHNRSEVTVLLKPL